MSTPSGRDLVPRIFWGKFLARGAELGSTDSHALILMCGWCGSRRGTDTANENPGNAAKLPSS